MSLILVGKIKWKLWLIYGYKRFAQTITYINIMEFWNFFPVFINFTIYLNFMIEFHKTLLLAERFLFLTHKSTFVPNFNFIIFVRII